MEGASKRPGVLLRPLPVKSPPSSLSPGILTFVGLLVPLSPTSSLDGDDADSELREERDLLRSQWLGLGFALASRCPLSDTSACGAPKESRKATLFLRFQAEMSNRLPRVGMQWSSKAPKLEPSSCLASQQLKRLKGEA